MNVDPERRLQRAEKLLKKLCDEVSVFGDSGYVITSEDCLEEKHVDHCKNQVMIGYRRDDAAIVFEMMTAVEFEMWDADTFSDRVPLFIVHGRDRPFLFTLLETLFHKASA